MSYTVGYNIDFGGGLANLADLEFAPSKSESILVTADQGAKKEVLKYGTLLVSDINLPLTRAHRPQLFLNEVGQGPALAFEQTRNFPKAQDQEKTHFSTSPYLASHRDLYHG